MTTRKNNGSNQTAGCSIQETPTLASVLSMATTPGDEVIYFGHAPSFDEVIQTAGAIPVHVGSDLSTQALDMAALVSALTPRTRAIVVGGADGLPGNAFSRAMLATLTQLLTTARNIFGQPVYLIADESANISCGDQPGAKRLADFYPFTRLSRTAAVLA